MCRWSENSVAGSRPAGERRKSSVAEWFCQCNGEWVADWHVTDEALWELIEDTVLGWLLEGRRGELPEPWIEMNEDPSSDE